MFKVLKWCWELIDDLAKAATSSGRVEILPESSWAGIDEEAERRNCNYCGYELLPEQTKPNLCGACYKHYLEEEGIQ